MKEYVNITNLLRLVEHKKWNIPILASKLNIDYSYLSRVVNKEKPGGAKLILGVLKLCSEEGLNHKDYIFLDAPLSVDNGEQDQHAACLPKTG